MSDEEHVLTGEAIRRLLYRRDVAVSRHRAAFARSLGITDIEMQALVHLAEQGELAPSAIAALLDLSGDRSRVPMRGSSAACPSTGASSRRSRRPTPTQRATRCATTC